MNSSVGLLDLEPLPAKYLIMSQSVDCLCRHSLPVSDGVAFTLFSDVSC